jgi:hypothetical protein
MTDGAGSGQRHAKRRIVASIVADIALRRAVPDVFLLNAAGEAIAWPARSQGVPRSLQPLVDMYFSQDAAHRVALTELVDIDRVQMQVRIVPYHGADASQYAMIVEPFVVRSRNAQGSGELTTTS